MIRDSSSLRWSESSFLPPFGVVLRLRQNVAHEQYLVLVDELDLRD
jgi:hypothetical protein